MFRRRRRADREAQDQVNETTEVFARAGRQLTAAELRPGQAGSQRAQALELGRRLAAARPGAGLSGLEPDQATEQRGRRGVEAISRHAIVDAHTERKSRRLNEGAILRSQPRRQLLAAPPRPLQQLRGERRGLAGVFF